jgi:hypothetical protein
MGTTDTVDLTVAELGNGRCVLKKLVVVDGGCYLVREAKDLFVPFDKVGSGVGVSSHCGQSMGSSQCKFNREVVANVASLAIVASPLSGAVVEWVCINWKDTAMKAI